MQKFVTKLEDIHSVINKSRDTRMLLITGKGSYKASGAEKILKPILEQYDYVHFNDVSPNPKLQEIKAAVNIYKSHRRNLIIAVGGGSVIDTAKATRILANQKEALETVIMQNGSTTKLEDTLIAVPTTAGSGAESTHFAVVYINKRKHSLSDKQALPDVVVLDPRLTYSLPPNVTAASGIDAVAQAIEAYWAIQSTELSRRYSRKALEQLLPNIETAVLKPNAKARQAMLEGANFAGRAINIAKTTACHALSYGFTAYYGVPHGQAVGLTLPSFILFNSNIDDNTCKDPRGVKFVKERISELLSLLGVDTAQSAKAKIENLISKIKLDTNHSDFDIALLTKAIDKDRLSNNPRKVSINQTQLIIREVLTK